MARNFISKDQEINNWEDIKNYFDNLKNRSINSIDDFNQWLEDISETEAFISENLGKRYIAMTIDTTDKKASESYMNFVQNIQPKLSPIFNELEKQLFKNEYANQINEDGFGIMLKRTKTSLELYREENIPLNTKESELTKKYGAIAGKQSIEWEGKEITMQEASEFLKNTDRSIRKEAFEKISDVRLKDADKLDLLFEELVDLRQQKAKNAGFSNFRDFKHTSMNRFDYTPDDCKEFHKTVKEIVVPIIKEFKQDNLNKLGFENFKPWDTSVDPEGKEPLKPFKTGKELLEKTTLIFDKIKDEFGANLREMDRIGHLDLESKKGKSPGGYNYPLYETGVPFIFMNAVGSQRDLVTMVHEGGHAMHSFLTKSLRLTSYKSLTSEIAELASMSMELISMDYWDTFYTSKDDLKRAKKEQIIGTIDIIPWIAQVDEFQHWIYENHDSGIEKRNDKWVELCSEYGFGLTDWTGYEDTLKHSWKRQLHIFEVPFYYIEYAISQLGSLGVWKNYQSNNEKGVNDYKNALSLGYTKSIPEVFETAGTKLDFSKQNISELISFVKNELKAYS
jgi:oligoendopeptidase F